LLKEFHIYIYIYIYIYILHSDVEISSSFYVLQVSLSSGMCSGSMNGGVWIAWLGKLPPPPNIYPTKEIHTPPFIDPPDTLTCNTQYDDEISTSLYNIDIYMTLFMQNCNCDNLKMATLGRNM